MIFAIQRQDTQLNDKVAVRIRTCGVDMSYGEIEFISPDYFLVLFLSDPGCPRKGSG
jgi:hypothetical protein